MTSTTVVVEACVTSAGEASACFRAGARRVELCRALEVGGLTPRRGDVEAAVAASPGPVFALARSRDDTFRLTAPELDELTAEVAALRSQGVDGVVLGVLDRAGRIDLPALKELVAAADGLPVTFHRAFDRLADPSGGLESLARAGVERVLTSGGADTAWQGREVLRELIEESGGEITVLGGGSIRGDHVRRLIEETGLAEVHARASAVPGVIEALR